ncbi:MAG: Ig-like domain repeat protein, partial [Actinomycetota bacterium]|nr:Ig-like domain repeat protein [Actinomycetota bacterium]
SPPTIAKSFGAATISVNGSTTLSFTITNPNAGFALSGVGFVDTLPVGLVVSTPNSKTGSCGGGTITAIAGSGSVSLANATLAGGAHCTLSVKVTGTTAGVEDNQVMVTSTNAGPGNTADATVTVVAPPNVAKLFGSASVPFGGTTTLTFSVTNPNPTVGLSGVGVVDTLPAGLVVANPKVVSGSCGAGVVTAAAGSSKISLAGATLAAGGSCSLSVDVTAKSLGVKHNVTSKVTSVEGGAGNVASATLKVVRAPTVTTVTVTPSVSSLGSPVTFGATVAPAGPNASGVNPTGTVSFFLDGGATPVATVALNPDGTASFTTSGLGAGEHTVTAGYSGDTNFLPSASTTAATGRVGCDTTLTGDVNGALIGGPGSTCVIGGHITGAVVVPAGSSLDLEGVTVDGSISADGAAFIRICGSTASAISVSNSTGFVLIGDAGDDSCNPNTLSGALTLSHNTGGVEAIGNHVAGTVIDTANSGTGPFPEDTAPDIAGNGP